MHKKWSSNTQPLVSNKHISSFSIFNIFTIYKLYKSQQQKKYFEWVDALRALAILFVVYCHRVQPDSFTVFINPIKMPLFFALSGYLFHIRPGGDFAFFKKTLTSLIIPWLFLGLIPLIASIPFKGFSHVFQSMVELFTGELLWFMPCFIIAQIIFYYVMKLTKNHLILTIISLIIVSAIGYTLKQKEILNTFMFNIAMIVQFYFMIGNLYKRIEAKLSNHRLKYGIILLFCYIVIGYITYPNGCTDIHNGRFMCVPISALMSIVGLLSLFLLSSSIKKYPKYILSVGKSTLVIYMLDRYLLIPFMYLYNFDNPPGSLYLIFIVALFYTIYSSTINVMIAKTLNKYIPWATGGRG